MTVNGEKYWQAELLWWIFTMVVVVLTVLPIVIHHIQFDFIIYNVVFVISAVTFSRLILFFSSHPLASSRVFKMCVVFMVPVVFFPILEGLHSFIEYNDREGLQTIVEHVQHEKQVRLMSYIRMEYLFFGITSFLGSLILIIKMIRSFWKQYKYGIS